MDPMISVIIEVNLQVRVAQMEVDEKSRLVAILQSAVPSGGDHQRHGGEFRSMLNICPLDLC